MASLGRSVESALRRGANGLRRRLPLFSDYDHTIPPEIFGDEFYDVIRSVARTANVRTMLEIGSSNGSGSTRAFVDGLHDNPNQPTLFCLEVSRPRFHELSERYANDPQVKCYNLTSVPLNGFPTEAEVIAFYQGRESKLNRVPLREVLRWLRQDLRYVGKLGAQTDGIHVIKKENGVDHFGVVLIDGSEFTGPAELDLVYGADHILLDDIGTFKNLGNFERLSSDPNYRMAAHNPELRNGYAVFDRREL